MRPPKRSFRQYGFTLLEVLVATAVLGIAVAALLGGLVDSLRVSGRVADYDRVTLAAKQKMEELLVTSTLPRFRPIEGRFDATSGWIARVTPWQPPLPLSAGSNVIDRVELEAWWINGSSRKSIKLESFRRGQLQPADIAAGAGQ